MSTPPLTPVSYVVLGLIARDGPLTPYALKQAAARGVANFWPFPHSQLYDEPARLAAAGLLREEQEAGGRRRKTYSLTPSGRRALRAWLSSPDEDAPQIRSLALLKLFFAGFGTAADLRDLARRQVALHEGRLGGMYPEIEARLEATPSRARQLDALRIARDIERTLVDHWRRLADASPD